MLKQNFIRKIKDYFQLRKERKIRKNQNIERILSGKTALYVQNFQTAEAIVQWCGDEEDSVQFFLKCLEKMGVKAPVKIVQLSEYDEYYSFEMQEREEQKIWNLTISKTPKTFLKLEIIFSEKVEYIFKRNHFELIVKEGKVAVKHYYPKTIRICIGNDIYITLTGVDWIKNENLYDISKQLIKDLKNIDEKIEPYIYYTKIKEEIQKYYNLKNVAIELVMNLFSILTKDEKLISYYDYQKGIIIKKYDKYSYKQYQKENIKLSWENSKFKCDGIPNKDIQKYIDIVERIIKEIESLKF